jgi:hypothetical protein
MSPRYPLPLAAILALLASAGAAHSPDPVLELARSRDPGIVTLLRHARAPAGGDAAGSGSADCITQESLSEQGRTQAQRLGEALRSVGVRDADVHSSESCRCLETARLMAVGPVRPATYLNPFVAGHDDDAAATRALRAAVLEKLDSRRPTFFVTEQVNITALTGIMPAEAEAVFVRATAAGTIEVVGRARLP